ncbi:hypothetical protein EJ06DRAFT_554414 [Trichodelitschia bisporula]|uniref:Uncharacterized protein n=1 Tax=Trichodelitschia bisporula TaxID=703511 RepID=A0A6G1I470_9PEZI|nr:hypothetical protein EJ06DRAFT_554414 [Trichodelitschia bisporula]
MQVLPTTRADRRFDAGRDAGEGHWAGPPLLETSRVNIAIPPPPPSLQHDIIFPRNPTAAHGPLWAAGAPQPTREQLEKRGDTGFSHGSLGSKR